MNKGVPGAFAATQVHVKFRGRLDNRLHLWFLSVLNDIYSDAQSFFQHFFIKLFYNSKPYTVVANNWHNKRY